jgi:hypothetical protein
MLSNMNDLAEALQAHRESEPYPVFDIERLVWPIIMGLALCGLILVPLSFLV